MKTLHKIRMTTFFRHQILKLNGNIALVSTIIGCHIVHGARHFAAKNHVTNDAGAGYRNSLVIGPHVVDVYVCSYIHYSDSDDDDDDIEWNGVAMRVRVCVCVTT